MRIIRPTDIFIGTNTERLTNFPGNLTDFEGSLFYETDTNRRYNIWREEWVQIPPYVLYGQTIDATPVELFQNDDGTGRIEVPNNTTYMFDIKVAAMRVDALGESCGLGYRGVIKNEVNTLTYINTPSKYFDDQEGTGWVLTFNISGTSMVISAVGEASKTINWRIHVEIVSVSGGAGVDDTVMVDADTISMVDADAVLMVES